MALNSYYAEARERWTWKKQVMQDLKSRILSALRKQHSGWCSYFALAATLEPNLRVQWQRSVSLSILHLSDLGDQSKQKLPTQRKKIKRLILMLQDEGVFEENQYENIHKGILAERDARRYKVTSHSEYRVDDPEDIRRALYQLRRGGPLLAVLRISSNYYDCYESGFVYRFDPDRIVKDENEVAETLCRCRFFCNGGEDALSGVPRFPGREIW